jgi:hypothetical protein
LFRLFILLTSSGGIGFIWLFKLPYTTLVMHYLHDSHTPNCFTHYSTQFNKHHGRWLTIYY